MQAEADANDDIKAKDFKHTAAYQIVANGIDPAVTPSLPSGSALRKALLRRARAKELGLDLSYQSSGIGSGDSYQKDAFKSWEYNRRQKKEAEAAEQDTSKGASYSGKSDSDKGSQSPYRRDAAAGKGGDTTQGQIPERPTPFSQQARERFGGKTPPPSTAAPRYNPYA